MTTAITCLKHNKKIYFTGNLMDVHLNYMNSNVEPVAGRLVHITPSEITIDCSSEYNAKRRTIKIDEISRIVSNQGVEVDW